MAEFMQPIDEGRDGIPRIYKAPADEQALDSPCCAVQSQPIPLYSYPSCCVVRETAQVTSTPEPFPTAIVARDGK